MYLLNETYFDSNLTYVLPDISEKSIVQDEVDFEDLFARSVRLQVQEEDHYDGGAERKEEDELDLLLLGKKKKRVTKKNLTPEEAVLKRCRQKKILDFQECFPESSLKNCQKIGEGVFGEVFLLKKSPTDVSVLKVIPIEGPYRVNGEPQKKYEEVLTEITIQSELSSLRQNRTNRTEAFSFLKKVSCVRGRYPERLIELWELFQEVKGTENDHPDIFDENQIYIVLELENGGDDLEKYSLYNSKQAISIFRQLACSLAVAESSLEFEHRDLHWGNVLVLYKDPKEPERFLLDGEEISVDNCGVKATIIDYTLSRIKKNDICIFYNLASDPDLFNGDGDYQFEIYRLMQKTNRNNWEDFNPYSNVLWLHYILGKLIKGVHYISKKTKVHLRGIRLLKELEKVLLNCESSKEVVNNLLYNFDRSKSI